MTHGHLVITDVREETPHHMAEHHTAGSEIPQSHTARSNGYGPEPVSFELGCGRRTALRNLELHARNDDDDDAPYQTMSRKRCGDLVVVAHDVAQPGEQAGARRDLRVHRAVHVVQQVQCLADQLVALV